MFRFSESVEKNTFLFRYSVGARLNYGITDALSFQPGLIFNVVGGKVGDSDAYSQTSLGYLSIPLNVAYGFGEKGSQFQIFAGPYLGYALTGKTTSKFGGDEESETVEFGSEDGKTNPMDFGINVGLGYRFGNILVNGGYMLGLSDLTNGSVVKTYNSGLTLGASMFFGGK